MTVIEMLIYRCHMELKCKYHDSKKKISSDKLWDETNKLYGKYLQSAKIELENNTTKYEKWLSKYGKEKTLHIIGIEQIKKDYNRE